MMKKIIISTLIFFLTVNLSVAQDVYSVKSLKQAYSDGKYLQAWDGFYNLAAENIPEAIYYIGIMSFWGQGQPQNYSYAHNRFKSAGEYGFAEGAYMTGVMELWGIGLKKQAFAQAYKNLLIAEKLGHEKAGILKPFARESITSEDARAMEAEVKNWKPKIPRQPK